MHQLLKFLRKKNCKYPSLFSPCTPDVGYSPCIDGLEHILVRVGECGRVHPTETSAQTHRRRAPFHRHLRTRKRETKRSEPLRGVGVDRRTYGSRFETGRGRIYQEDGGWGRGRGRIPSLWSTQKSTVLKLTPFVETSRT